MNLVAQGVRQEAERRMSELEELLRHFKCELATLGDSLEEKAEDSQIQDFHGDDKVMSVRIEALECDIHRLLKDQIEAEKPSVILKRDLLTALPKATMQR